MLQKLYKILNWFKKDWLTKTTLFLIFTLALAIRAYNIESVPPALFCDETSVGVNAKAILNSAKDEHGNFLPIYFPAFGDYKNPLQIYLDVPFVLLFGLNEFSVRFPSALFGSLAIPLIYLILKKIFDKTTGLLGAFLLTIMPWHIIFSRWGNDGLILFPTLVLLSLYFTIKSKEKPVYIYFAAISWGLTIYSYSTARLFVPLAVALLITYHLKTFKKHPKHFIYAGIIFILFCLPFLIFIIAHPVPQWNEKLINLAGLSFLEIIGKITSNYFGHFLPKFLLEFGGIERHGVRETGLILEPMLPLSILGLICALFSLKKTWPILVLFLLYPIGGTFSNSGPYATRDTVGTIVFAAFSAIGIYFVFKSLNKLKNNKTVFYAKIFGLNLILISNLFSFGYFYWIYQNVYPLYSANAYWGWQYGLKEAVLFFQQNQNKYDEMFLPKEGLNGPFNQSLSQAKFYASNVKNIYAGEYVTKLNPKKRQLFAARPQERLKNARIIYAIYNPSGLRVLNIWETLVPKPSVSQN